jgi:signal transduction histidine kinase
MPPPPEEPQPPRVDPGATGWLLPQDAAGLRDLWRIYDQRFAEVEPGFDAPAEEVRGALRQAVLADEWGPYGDLVARCGARCADLGLGADAQEEARLQLTRGLVPRLIEAYGDAPDRLTAALLALQGLLAHRSSVLGAAYQRAREAAATRAQRALAEWLEANREDERTRTARALHDDIGQTLAAVRLDLGWVIPKLREGPHVVAVRLVAVVGWVDAMLAAARQVEGDLRPAVLDDLGLADAVAWQAREFERRSGIRVDLEVEPEELGSIDPPRATAMFRMLQEILANVARHAGAARVTIRLIGADPRVTLEVADDGRGIRPEEITSPDSLGLRAMRERAAQHGGSFRIAAGPAGGTVVTVNLPRGAA